MDALSELRVREILFYAQCQLFGMIAENQARMTENKSLAYKEGDFAWLAEQTREQFQNNV